jgi:hypothetical protein
MANIAVDHLKSGRPYYNFRLDRKIPDQPSRGSKDEDVANLRHDLPLRSTVRREKIGHKGHCRNDNDADTKI